MRARRIGAVLALAAGGVLLAAGPASAAEVPAATPAVAIVAAPWDDNCATPPDIDAPVIGALGTARPDVVKGNDVSMYQQYAFSGMNWWTYDLGSPNVTGCLPDGTSIGASTSTTMGNFFFRAAEGLVMLDDMVLRRAYTSDWMGIFDPFVGRAVTSLHDAVFSPWSLVALTLLGLLVLMKAYRASLNDATIRAGTAIVVLTAVFLIVSQPVSLIHRFYDGLDQGTVTISTSITGQTAADGSQPGPADAMIATLHRTMIYRVWLEGVLGDADSPIARKYGPQLLADTAMTYTEAEKRGTPEFTKLVEKKQADFKALAAKIKGEDPVAYTYLQGKHADQRTGKAIRAIIGTGGASPVLLAGSMAMMMSKLIALFAIVMSMIVLVAAIVRGSIGLDLLDRVLSGVATALVWCAALPISMLANDAALNNPKLDPITSTIILIAVNVSIFYGAYTIAPGFSGVIRRRHVRQGQRWSRFALQAAASFVGARSGAAAAATPTAQTGPEIVDATIDPDDFRAAPAAEYVDGEDWTRQPMPSAARTAGSLPAAPVTPDDVKTASERDGRTLRDQPPTPEPERPGGGSPAAAPRREGSSEVYDIYSGNPAPQESARADDDADGPLSIGGGSE